MCRYSTVLSVFGIIGQGDELRDGWAFRVGTWNVDSLTGRLGELVEAIRMISPEFLQDLFPGFPGLFTDTS